MLLSRLPTRKDLSPFQGLKLPIHRIPKLMANHFPINEYSKRWMHIEFREEPSVAQDLRPEPCRILGRLQQRKCEFAQSSASLDNDRVCFVRCGNPNVWDGIFQNESVYLRRTPERTDRQRCFLLSISIVVSGG